jgi:hypothetical protein
MEQAANQASGSGNPLVPGVTSQTKARKKRLGGSSLTTWLTLAVLVILAATFFLYLLVLRSSLVIKYREENKPKGGAERCLSS